MYLTYLDESYDKKKYWIAAVICPEGEARGLIQDLDDVVTRASRAYTGISSTSELHGHSLFQAKDDWEPLAIMPRARIGIYNEAFAAIASHDVRIYIRGIDIPAQKVRYVRPDHPHAVVLMHLLERIDEHAEESNELVIVIADELAEEDNYRKNLWRFQRTATTGWNARKLDRIVDTMHFAPSSASRLVQAADLVAFLWYRIDSGTEKDERAKRANAALWARIESKVLHCFCWTP
jgi:hypothetical protein